MDILRTFVGASTFPRACQRDRLSSPRRFKMKEGMDTLAGGLKHRCLGSYGRLNSVPISEWPLGLVARVSVFYE